VHSKIIERGNLAHSHEDYRPGDVIAGKYELLHLLGQGGMSSVWAVQNLVLDAQFALKLIQNDGDEHAGERMLREARATSRIDHPAIIRIFDFGVTDQGDPFLVMELLQGETLRDRLVAHGRLRPVEAVRILLPIAEGLSIAHAHSVIHRDLKPDNIVCVPAEVGRFQPKIIDFGIAKRVDQDSSRITQAGFVLGSPDYMSPEQALGQFDVDHRTDIWSFCIVLYEAITGTTPFFRDREPMAVLRAVVEQPIAPIADFGVHDRELWSIIAHGLEKVPGSRWNDMHSLGAALARWLVHQGVEEDICMQSVRMVWLGSTTASAPPLAMDSREVERARLEALAEDYSVPKKSLVKTTFGMAAALLTVAFIGVAAFRLVRMPAGILTVTPATVAHEKAPPPPPLDPALVPPPPPEEEPSAAAPPSATVTSPKSEEAAPSAAAPATAAQEPTTKTAAPDDARAAKTRSAAVATVAAPRARKRTSSKPVRAAAPIAPPASDHDLSPTERQPTSETQLPQLKPPPEFEAKPSDNPYKEKNDAPARSSDNPY
jgi:serine/threonine protein kinase